jgi:glycine/D-amino acid oxidase-like deaminating enzyme
MAARALILWRQEQQTWNQVVLFKSGALWMCAADDAYVRSSIAPVRAAGLPIDELTPAEAARRYPQFSFAGVRTAFVEPEAGFLTARVACELVRETFLREGGTYRQAMVRPGVTGNRDWRALVWKTHNARCRPIRVRVRPLDGAAVP